MSITADGQSLTQNTVQKEDSNYGFLFSTHGLLDFRVSAPSDWLLQCHGENCMLNVL